MLTRDERMMLRAKIRVVEEAIEDLRAVLDPMNFIPLPDAKQRSIICRNAIAELKRYMEEDLS